MRNDGAVHQGLMVDKGNKCSILIDVICDHHAIVGKMAVGSIKLEHHMVVRMQAVVDEHVGRAQALQRLGQDSL